MTDLKHINDNFINVPEEVVPEEVNTGSPKVEEVEVNTGSPKVEDEVNNGSPKVEVPVDNSPKSGYNVLVLSGGSIKGLAILGAIQYASDNKLLTKVDTFIGTSAGAMISYLLCIGYTPIEMIVYLCKQQLLEKMQTFNLVAMIQGRGASSFNYLSEHLEKMTIDKIGYLPTMLDIYKNFGKTLVCATHNLTEKRTEYIRHETHPNVPCITALRMSANIPLIFERFKYGHSLYVDGGISDNFPIQLGDLPGKKVLGIMLRGKQGNLDEDIEQNTLEYIFKLMIIPIDQSVHYKIKSVSDNCRVVQLVLDKSIKFFNFNVASSVKLDLFTQGYDQMRNNIELN